MPPDDSDWGQVALNQHAFRCGYNVYEAVDEWCLDESTHDETPDYARSHTHAKLANA